MTINYLHKNKQLKLLQYKNIILPLLEESFDSREAQNLFKYACEDYFNKRYMDLKEYVLNDDEIEELNYAFEKLANHYPIQYLFKKAHFYGFDFYVDENVLIPRPETEELVNLILSDNKLNDLKTVDTMNNFSLLDFGTGSGCIPIILKKYKPEWNIYALDIAEKALQISKKNALDNTVEINFIQADILNLTSEIANLKFDVIVSNPPYIPYKEKELMSSSTVQYEPVLALFVENEQPLLFYNKIADLATKYLKNNGRLFFELNEFYADEVYQLVIDKKFEDVSIVKDLAGKKRMLSATFISKPL